MDCKGHSLKVQDSRGRTLELKSYSRGRPICTCVGFSSKLRADEGFIMKLSGVLHPLPIIRLNCAHQEAEPVRKSARRNVAFLAHISCHSNCR